MKLEIPAFKTLPRHVATFSLPNYLEMLPAYFCSYFRRNEQLIRFFHFPVSASFLAEFRTRKRGKEQLDGKGKNKLKKKSFNFHENNQPH